MLVDNICSKSLKSLMTPACCLNQLCRRYFHYPGLYTDMDFLVFVVKRMMRDKLVYSSSQFDFAVVIEMESVLQVLEINAAIV